MKLKRIHMLYGIGAVPDRDAYGVLELAVREFADELDDPDERIVMDLYVLRGMSSVAVGIRMFCSDRQVRRVYERILERLDE